MTTVFDVPSELSTYMLKGYILTDSICPQCHKVPLLRSPSAARQPVQPFCVKCDPPSGSSFLGTTSKFRSTQPASQSTGSESSADAASLYSRSTAPTEISSNHGSPELVPVDTPEIVRRRQQSDTAAAEIGRRLLKGWAMLADECPSPDCYGVPLVRPPKSGGEKDPRKECVICGSIYVDHVGPNGVVSLVYLEPEEPPHPAVSTDHQLRSRNQIEDVDGAQRTATENVTLPGPLAVRPSDPLPASQHQGSMAADTLELPLIPTVVALGNSLQSLTDRLQVVSSPGTFDATLIGQMADAISKVSQALLSVKQLQRGST